MPSTGKTTLSKRTHVRKMPNQIAPPVIKLDPVWSSKRMAVLDGRQVRCMTFDEVTFGYTDSTISRRSCADV